MAVNSASTSSEQIVSKPELLRLFDEWINSGRDFVCAVPPELLREQIANLPEIEDSFVSLDDIETCLDSARTTLRAIGANDGLDFLLDEARLRAV